MIKSSKLISGLLAFTVYFTVIGLLLFYFNTRDEKKSVHYVKKDEHRIQVALSAPSKDKKTREKPKSKPKPKPKPKPKRKPQVKSKPKPKKEVKKKIIKEKRVKKLTRKKDENLTKPKKKQTLDLFANIKTPKKKNIIKVTDEPQKVRPKNNLIKVSDKTKSASERISSSLKIRKSSDSGVENAYFAKIEEKLKGWPAQSEYAGEMAKVWFKVQPSGSFEFKVITASGNESFNTGLIAYLKQLQRLGFGRHKGDRAYELDVEFVATE
ncbi:TonB C-terminal domain-containing protein [Sulfurovum sp.]|jgi:protein TonB|uniref:TonB C-terminal domain-containing protein n=1 Tax=Sulfurovum sp. TaxID=1969726 RepID=UPI0025FF1322|nr:TonB C-terminal domain-containing protein [Sulfurovum sp.]